MIYVVCALAVVGLIGASFIIGVLMVALDRDRRERAELTRRLLNALLANEHESPAEAFADLERIAEPTPTGVPANVTEEFLIRERLSRQKAQRDAQPAYDEPRPIGMGG